MRLLKNRFNNELKTIWILTASIFIFFNLNLFGQDSETHIWKLIQMDNGEKFWYDAAGIDTINGDQFNIWVLTVNKPPVKYEGVDGEVYRVKTLYGINLTSVRYGFATIRYYDVQNKEIYSFDYDNPPPPESIKYPYPITENSIFHEIIKAIFGPGGLKSGQ